MKFEESYIYFLVVYSLDDESCTLPKLYNSQEKEHPKVPWYCAFDFGGVNYDILAAYMMNFHSIQLEMLQIFILSLQVNRIIQE